MAVLLAQRPQVALEVQAGREVEDRADLLALADHGPAVRGKMRPECRYELVGSRIAAAEASEVDDVPRFGVRVARSGADGQGVRNRASDRGQVRRPREDRRIVRVVAGPEEDGFAVRRDGRDFQCW